MVDFLKYVCGRNIWHWSYPLLCLPASLWATVNLLASVSSTRSFQPICAVLRRFKRSAILDGLRIAGPILSRNLTSIGEGEGEGGVPDSKSNDLWTLFFQSSSPLCFSKFNLQKIIIIRLCVTSICKESVQHFEQYTQTCFNEHPYLAITCRMWPDLNFYFRSQCISYQLNLY